MPKNHRVSWKNQGKGKGCSERFVRLFPKKFGTVLIYRRSGKFLGFLKKNRGYEPEELA
jgi:hypothetical protein